MLRALAAEEEAEEAFHLRYARAATNRPDGRNSTLIFQHEGKPKLYPSFVVFAAVIDMITKLGSRISFIHDPEKTLHRWQLVDDRENRLTVWDMNGSERPDTHQHQLNSEIAKATYPTIVYSYSPSVS